MMNNNIYVPVRFQNAISYHVVCNLLAQEIGNYPLILGIHGPPGTGKTFQCEHVLSALGVQTFWISPAEMEHEDAGTPARLLRKRYVDASEAIERQKSKSAVLILNDIDTGLGDWHLQGTVNRQHIFGELMRFTDNPYEIEGCSVHRIPIIMTGNDLTSLYYPLLRPGRTRLFEWIPNSDEKLDILRGIFPEYNDQVCAEILSACKDQSIGYFVELRARLYEDLAG